MRLGSTAKSILDTDESEKENFSARRPSAFHIRSEPSLDIETASRWADDDIPIRLCTTQTARNTSERVITLPRKLLIR